MLNIYIGRDNLPKDKQFIFDIEDVIYLVKITGTEFQRMVLRRVEHGDYYNNELFKDRFGGLLYYNEMSTGSKALFEVESLRDCVINCSECGENALRLLSNLRHGNVFLNDRNEALQWDIDCEVSCNGRVWSKISLLNDYLR